MATQTQEAPTVPEQQKTSGVKQTAEKDVKIFQAFFTKFTNDWVMNFAAGLAFNLITAILPMLIAIIAIAGYTIGNLNPTIYANLITSLQSIFTNQLSSKLNFLNLAITSLHKNAGPLVIIAILLALFGGSRLFVTIEGYFDIIYHTRPRGVIQQNIMAIVMLLVFVVLTPLMVFASFIPALIQTVLKAIPPLSPIAHNGFIFVLLGILASVCISWVLFEAIYIVVPNQRISFRNSWLGALVAAVLLQVYLTLFFPFYVTHFLGSYTGVAGFAVILLFFFYYFAVILLLGAEINAFFAEGVRTTPDNLAVMVHAMTSHLPTSERAMQEQASVSHKHEEPKEILPKSEVNHLEAQAAKAPQVTNTPGQVEPTSTREDHAAHQGEKRKPSAKGSSRALPIVEAIAGISLAFILQLFGLRRKKK